MIDVTSSHKETNQSASGRSVNDGGTLEQSLERLELQEDEDNFGTSDSDCLPLLNGKQNNGHSAPQQHMNQNETDKEDKDCLEKVLHQVSTGMGLKPIPKARYKPVRQPQRPPTPQSALAPHGRTMSNPTFDNAALQISHSESPSLNPNRSFFGPNNSNNSTKQPGVVRRRPSTRRQSDVSGIKEPVINKPPPGQLKDKDTRQSFELKQNAIYSMQTDGTLEQLSALENLRVEEQWQSSQNFWRRLALQASTPDTSQKELIQRSTFLVISSLTVGAGMLWGLMYVALEEWTAALMPFIYSTSMSIILFTCICNSSKNGKGYDTFVNCQLALILLLPFAVHVALGGVEKSGGVMLWSFLCPMGAAFFRSAKESLRWFWIYLSVSGLLLVMGFWDVDDYELDSDASDMNRTSNHSHSETTIQKLYFLMNIIGVKCVIFAAVFLFARELEKEYTKSEEVLLNILPSSIVKRIKRGEFPIVDHVSGVTILFADLVGFTKASTEFHPNFLIGLFLRDIFHAFDELVYDHGLEKIKTIGDAYMVVGGLNHGEKLSPQSRRQSEGYKGQKPHATNTMLLAVDMLEALRKVNRKYNLHFQLRIGVHTGPVVAGVLGLKRFTYDVWGDSVNTASRMESNGLPSLIHISSDMHESICAMTDVFDFSCCGKIAIKGKGEMTTFLARPLVESVEELEKNGKRVGEIEVGVG